MIKLGKLGVAAVFSLLLGLVLCTTGASAHRFGQRTGRSNIHASARAAVLNTRNVRRPYGWGEGSEDGGDGWGGGCGGGDCGGFAMRQAFHETMRCTAMHECRSVRECHQGPWGGGCRSIRICRKISVCHRCRTRVGWGGSGWAGSTWGGGGQENSWAAKH